MNDIDVLLQEIAELKRRVAGVMRHGTVKETKPGFVRIDWSHDGETGSDDEKFTSPWIRTSHHAGFITENVPFKIGQTVTSLSMDPDHLQGVVFPHSPSDQNPKDGNAKDDAHTYRIRKPQDSGSGGQSSSGGTGSGQSSAAKDDDEDFTHETGYNGHNLKVGSKIQIMTDREGKKVFIKNDTTSYQLDHDTITTKVGDSSTITQKADQIIKQVGDVMHKITASGHDFGNSGTLTHKGVKIDGTHVHKDVMTGTDTTGIPIP